MDVRKKAVRDVPVLSRGRSKWPMSWFAIWVTVTNVSHRKRLFEL